MPDPRKLKDRYDLKDPLGRGGMGVVWRAYDTVLRCDVAIKMLRDAPDAGALRLFQKESETLATLNHPNIVQILDQGEFSEDGHVLPYFVMPLLQGATLDKLLQDGPLSTERSLDILAQVCRGLGAAHECSVIHRDLKPGNIFVMRDDSVEIIDFGVCHLTHASSTKGQKGTLAYMAPELLQLKPPTVLSDIYSLAVLAYRMLGGRCPFENPGERELVAMILNEPPPSLVELNPGLNPVIARVIHKGMAKQQWQRFSTAKDFADSLQKAHRGEPIPSFDVSRIQPRIERVQKALDQGDYEFASEILGELQSEGHIDPQITSLHTGIQQAMRQKRVQQVLEIAKTRLEADEPLLALQRVEEALTLDPENPQATELKRQIERAGQGRQVEQWVQVAQQHLENHSYTMARDAIRNVLNVRPDDVTAKNLLTEIHRGEQNLSKVSKEMSGLYESAVKDFDLGNVTLSLQKLEKVLELDKGLPDAKGRGKEAGFQAFYNQVRSESEAVRNAQDETRMLLEKADFDGARAVCDRILAKYPENALFQALRFDVEERRRLQVSSFIAATDRVVEAEPDLERKQTILREALAQHPGEAHFERALAQVADRLTLVRNIEDRARRLGNEGQLDEAAAQWDTLRAIYPGYPSMAFELEQLQRKRDEAATRSIKAQYTERAETLVNTGEFEMAFGLIGPALQEFPADPGLLRLQEQASQGQQQKSEARQLAEQAEDWFRQAKAPGGSVKDGFTAGVQALQKAAQLDPGNPAYRNGLVTRLVEQAREVMDRDEAAAERLVLQALEVDPQHPVANTLILRIEDRRQDRALEEKPLPEPQKPLGPAPEIDFANTIIYRPGMAGPLGGSAPAPVAPQAAPPAVPPEDSLRQRDADLAEMRRLGDEAARGGADQLRTALAAMLTIAARHPVDRDFKFLIGVLEERIKAAIDKPSKAPVPKEERKPLSPPGAPNGAKAADRSAEPFPIGPSQPGPAEAVPAVDMAATQIFLPKEPKPAAQSSAPAKPVQPAVNTADVQKSAVEKKTVAANSSVTQPVDAKKASPASEAFPSAPKAKPEIWKVAVAAAVMLVVLGAGYFAFRPGKQEEAKAPEPVAFHLETLAGSQVLRDGEVVGNSSDELRLPPGEYDLVVRQEGYEPETVHVQLQAGAANPVFNVILRPERARLVVFTPFTSGAVTVDGGVAGQIAATGQFISEPLSDGDHTVRIESGSSVIEMPFKVAAGSLPVAGAATVSTGLEAITVIALGPQAHVTSSLANAPLQLDGAAATTRLVKGESDLQNLPAGSHTLVLGSGARQWSGSFDATASPLFNVHVVSMENQGRISVEVSGTDQVRIQVSGVDRGLAKNGRMVLSLKPGDYEVRAVRDGFTASPDRSMVTVQKDGNARVKFQMTEVARNTSSTSKAPEAANEPQAPTVGTARLQISPIGADVSYTRVGEQPRKITGTSVELEPGDYIFIGSAPGFTSSRQTVQIRANSATNVEISLAPVRVEIKGPIRRGMSLTEWDGGLVLKDGWYTGPESGKGTALYKPSPLLGSLTFKTQLKGGGFLRGSSKIEWVADYRDGRNFIGVEFDRQTYRRVETRDGRKGKAVEKRHGISGDVFSIRVTVDHSAVTVEAGPESGGYQVLDKWTATDIDPSIGRFGFRLDDNLKFADFVYAQAQ